MGCQNEIPTGSKLRLFGVEGRQSAEQRKCLPFTRAKLGGPIISPDFWSRDSSFKKLLGNFNSSPLAGCCCPNFRLAHHDENGSCHLHCMLNYLQSLRFDSPILYLWYNSYQFGGKTRPNKYGPKTRPLVIKYPYIRYSIRQQKRMVQVYLRLLAG